MPSGAAAGIRTRRGESFSPARPHDVIWLHLFFGSLAVSILGYIHFVVHTLFEGSRMKRWACMARLEGLLAGAERGCNPYGFCFLSIFGKDFCSSSTDVRSLLKVSARSSCSCCFCVLGP